MKTILEQLPGAARVAEIGLRFLSECGVEISLDTARTSACATGLKVEA